MLLIEPPVTMEEWSAYTMAPEEFSRTFGEYCEAYERSVLQLPEDQLARIIAVLMTGFEDFDSNALALRRMVERELSETEFEASSKVAKLVVLWSLVATSIEPGAPLSPLAEELMTSLQERVPETLVLAIDDHFGLLQAAG